MSDKKKTERFYLDEFFKLLGETPKDVQDGESPDFIVELHQTKIGMEVTEFHSDLKSHSDLKGEKGWPRRVIEETWTSLQRAIMEEVGKYKKLEKTNGLLFFKELRLPPKSEYKQFISELIKLSLEMVRSDCREMKPGTNYSLLNKYLEKFYLEKVGCYISWEWNHNAAFIGLTELELINTIKPKIDKAASYQQKDIDKLWLLVVSGPRLSQTMPIHISDKLHSFHQLHNLLSQSNYEKAYIYQYMLGVIFEWPRWVKIGKEKIYPTVYEG